MSSSIRFTRPCATCGRNLEIPIAHLGREVACGHCSARFVASMTDSSSSPGNPHNLDERIDRLLAAGTSSFDRLRTFQPTTHAPTIGMTYEV